MFQSFFFLGSTLCIVVESYSNNELKWTDCVLNLVHFHSKKNYHSSFKRTIQTWHSTWSKTKRLIWHQPCLFHGNSKLKYLPWFCLACQSFLWVWVYKQLSLFPVSFSVTLPPPSTTASNPCEENDGRGPCSHLCLINYNRTASCTCPHLMKLSPNKQSCFGEGWVCLLFSTHATKSVYF